MQDFLESDDRKKKGLDGKVNLLFFQLSELVNNPPTTIDFYDWRSNINALMKEIKRLSPEDHKRLDDLVEGVKMRGEKHIIDLDAEESPAVVAHSQEHYFQSVAMLESEINQLKRL